LQIQWYPGHMAKAKKLISESVKLVDMVIEVLDARIPASSINPEFDAYFSDKLRVVVLNKNDHADPEISQKWAENFRIKGLDVHLINSLSSSDIKRLKKSILALSEKKRNSIKQKKGINKVIRTMVVGIPNVGKSTLINSLSGAAKAKVGNKPGVTQGKQWVKVHNYLELLDTPGLLWPKLDDKTTALHLAYTGCIKEEILDLEEIARHFLDEMTQAYPDAILNRFGIDPNLKSGFALLDDICEKRGWIKSGGLPDRKRGAKQLLDEYRSGKLGRITLESPS
jgi:ribosome biogenesis GTPase A